MISFLLVIIPSLSMPFLIVFVFISDIWVVRHMTTTKIQITSTQIIQLCDYNRIIVVLIFKMSNDICCESGLHHQHHSDSLAGLNRGRDIKASVQNRFCPRIKRMMMRTLLVTSYFLLPWLYLPTSMVVNIFPPSLFCPR